MPSVQRNLLGTKRCGIGWTTQRLAKLNLIAESSGNQRLVSLLDQLFDAMALLRIQTLQQNPAVLEIRLEHRQVYEAIAQKEAATATVAIQLHLLASKARVVKEIQGSP